MPFLFKNCNLLGITLHVMVRIKITTDNSGVSRAEMKGKGFAITSWIYACLWDVLPGISLFINSETIY